MIEIELADDVAECGGVSCSRPTAGSDFARRAHGVRDQVIDDRVHFHRHVVARDDWLRLDLRNLLAQVDRRAHRVEEGQHGVEARFGRAVIRPSRSMIFTCFWNDLDRPHQCDQQEDRQAERQWSCS